MIIFLVFCCNSNTSLLAESVLSASHLSVRPLFGAHPKIDDANFVRGWSLPVLFTSLRLLANCYIFLSSITRPSCFFVWFSSWYQYLSQIHCCYVFILNHGARCYDYLDSNNLSLSPVYPFSYIFRPLPLSCSWSVNFGRKQLTNNRSP